MTGGEAGPSNVSRTGTQTLSCGDILTATAKNHNFTKSNVNLAGQIDFRQIRPGRRRDRSEFDRKGTNRMSFGEELFLGLVILSLTAFALVLASVTWIERSWAKKNGK
jgi:hypothetical protein